MLIRKNTKAFKTILEIVSACQGRADREQLIRLFITKAGTTVKDRISVDTIQGDSALFYEMNYQTVLNSLHSPNHQLNQSEEIPGLYFFHSSSNKRWDETPFEFDEAVKTEFSALPDLPNARKREKSEKFILPTAKTSGKISVTKTSSPGAPKVKKPDVQSAKQPDFRLKHKIEFTHLDRIIFRQPQLNKEQILTYYSKISEHLLPYIKDRQQWVRTSADRSKPLVQLTKEILFENAEDSVPEWLHTKTGNKNSEGYPLLANDKEHLLLYVERGALEFHPCLSKAIESKHPDYILIEIDSPDSDITKAVHVAREARTILEGLTLPSFVKTDGLSGLHLYIPLDAKASFKQSRDCAKYICKLINLKIPNLVALPDSGENSYGKVSLDYSLNEAGQSIVAPYSLVAGESVTIAAPLLWDEVDDTLRADDFNPESIFKRLKQVGDPFQHIAKKKVDAGDLFQRLQDNYGFLF